MKNVKLDIIKNYPENINEILGYISVNADKIGARVFLVGGMVRDLLLNNPSLDLDVAVEGESGIKFAKKLAQIIDSELKVYPKFETACMKIEENLEIDIATCRKEIYPAPGALPEVEPARIKEDLYRRDCTINAIAISLNKESFGDVLDYYRGIKDLRAKLIKVMHKKSFVDDPTRILRGIKYVARLKFNFESQTENLLKEAVEEGGLYTISKERIRDELKLLLKEEECYEQIKTFDEYVGLNFLSGRIKLNRNMKDMFNKAKYYLKRFKQEVKCDKISFFISEDTFWIVNFMILTEELNIKDVKDIIKKFKFSNNLKNRVIRYKESNFKIPKLIDKIDKLRPSQVYGILNRIPTEAVFVVLSKVNKDSAKEKIWSFLVEDKFIKIQIDGEDLKQIGLKPGPKFNTILTKVFYAKIDGKVKNRQEELDFAKRFI